MTQTIYWSQTEKSKLRLMEVAKDSLPKPRKRSCLIFIGNCLLMFEGFNSYYNNDLHYINISQIRPKPKRTTKSLDIRDLLECENWQTSLSLPITDKYSYFNNLLKKQLKCDTEDLMEITIPCGGVEKLEPLLTFMITGYLVVPADLSCKEWIDMHIFADFFSFTDIESIIYYQISSSITQQFIDDIVQFAEEYNLGDLAVACTWFFQRKNCGTKISESNKYYKISQKMNRLQIKQEVMAKNIPFVCKKKNSSTEDMEEDKENNVESCPF